MSALSYFPSGAAVLTVAYIALAILGTGYVLVSAFLGHVSDTGGGGHDAHAASSESHYGVDGSGHGGTHASAADRHSDVEVLGYDQRCGGSGLEQIRHFGAHDQDSLGLQDRAGSADRRHEAIAEGHGSEYREGCRCGSMAHAKSERPTV